jgi:hypothetical protein
MQRWGLLAQLVERFIRIEEAAGSIPAQSTRQSNKESNNASKARGSSIPAQSTKYYVFAFRIFDATQKNSQSQTLHCILWRGTEVVIPG